MSGPPEAHRTAEKGVSGRQKARHTPGRLPGPSRSPGAAQSGTAARGTAAPQVCSVRRRAQAKGQKMTWQVSDSVPRSPPVG